MIKFAITGTAGSGKSVVCARLKELGVFVIDLDTIAREVVMPDSLGLKEIVSYFGKDIICADGSLNRKMLRQIIIKDTNAKSALERILHPKIQENMLSRLDKANIEGYRIAVVEVPLLFETGMEKLFDKVVVVATSDTKRLANLMNRDKISENEATALVNAQMPQSEKMKLAHEIIQNEGSYQKLVKTTDEFYNRVMKNSLTADKG